MRATVLTPLLLLGLSFRAIGQSPAPSPSEKPALEAQSPAASDNELKFVVALFRHGVRAPLKPVEGDDPKKKPHAANSWPTEPEWGAKWGNLTPHGRDIATALGNYYATWYQPRTAWPNGFNVYLWADTDPRTIDTANALAKGLQQPGIPQVTVKSLPSGRDPLFHPFEAGCGTPNSDKLERTIADVNKAREEAAQKLGPIFEDLYGVLNCRAALACLPLKTVMYTVERCTAAKDSSAKKCESPITWSENVSGKPGPFPYASTAAEVFLLEYANNMPLDLVGWKRVDAAKNLVSMMQLHETYFDLTDRQFYLAQIQGSNLIREILEQLKRGAGQPIAGGCPRANPNSNFVGLVGHDTNLASINALLKLQWAFDDKNLPRDTLGLPANDALPAGALVFELRKRTDGYWVRVEYVTQSLEQMRTGPVVQAFRLNVDGPPCANKRPCEIPLTNLETLVRARTGSDFLSGCTDTVPPEQSCGSSKAAP